MRIIQFGSAMSTFGKNYVGLFATYSSTESSPKAVCKTGEHMSVDTGLSENYFSTFRLEFV
jgi:hypothetical protein